MSLTEEQQTRLRQLYTSGGSAREIMDLITAFEHETTPTQDRPGPLATKRHLLEMQVSTHQGKAEKAQQLLDALRMVPDRDPYEDGQVLRVQVGSFTYALLRARGLWYATGRDGRAPYKAGWAAVADWLVSNGVTQFAEMVGASEVWLDGTLVESDDSESSPANPFGRCLNPGSHKPHIWVEAGPIETRRSLSCPGANLAREDYEDRA